MRFPPPEIVSSFPNANFDNPQKAGPGLLITNLIFMVLATLAVTLRMYVRAYIKRRVGSDDIFIVVALIFAIGLGVNSILANQVYGWDRHIWDLPFTLYPPSLICAMAGKVLFSLAATFTRISLILFYYRLIHDAHIRWYRWMLHGSLAWTIAVCVTFVFLSIFLCLPVQAYWTIPPIIPQTCLNEGTVTLAAGTINSLSDLLTTVLPIPLILRLHLPLRQRLAVLFLLCLGIVVTAAGAVRTYFVWKSLVASWDVSWYAFYLWIAACVEIDLAVICACAPALKPLFSRMGKAMGAGFGEVRSWSERGEKKGSSREHEVSMENLAASGEVVGWRPPKPMRKHGKAYKGFTGLSTMGSTLLKGSGGRESLRSHDEAGARLENDYGACEGAEMELRQTQDDDQVLYVRQY